MALATLWMALLACTSFSTVEKALQLDEGVEAHEGLDAIYEAFHDGYRRLDASMVAGVYTEAALYLSPGGDIRRGRKAIEESFSGWFESLREQGGELEISFRIIERRVSGDQAYEVGIFNLLRRQGGEASQSRGKFVTVSLLQPDGSWKFQVDAYNGW